MKGKKSFFFSMLAFYCGVSALPVNAAEPIRFESRVSARIQHEIQAYLQKSGTGFTVPAIAGIDLNEDGIGEFIVRDSGCTDSGDPCMHLILADDGQSVLELGRIKAKRLLLGKSYTSGVRDILAAENPANDYDYQLYVWEPQESRYTIKGKGT